MKDSGENAMLMRRNGDIFLASTAIVTGDVRLSPGVNVWFGAVVRGDVAPITLGENVNLQDGVIVHCDNGVPNVIGPGVVAGHAAVLHGRRVGSGPARSSASGQSSSRGPKSEKSA
jgi:carbonic anhydrase/acetyltransferase-like protein (isoleucine patch superfamily)